MSPRVVELSFPAFTSISLFECNGLLLNKRALTLARKAKEKPPSPRAAGCLQVFLARGRTDRDSVNRVPWRTTSEVRSSRSRLRSTLPVQTPSQQPDRKSTRL